MPRRIRSTILAASYAASTWAEPQQPGTLRYGGLGSISTIPWRPGPQEVQLYYVGFEEYFLRSNIELALSEYSIDAADRT